MIKSEIFYGKSIDEAKSKAVDEFGVAEEKIKFTVLEDVKKGLFGKIKSEAKVQAEYEEVIISNTQQAEVSQNVSEQNDNIANEDNSEVKAVSEDKLQICKNFIKKVLVNMQIDCDVNVSDNEGSILANIDSKGSGAVIGRRGETLDALQYLTSLVVNKGEGDYIRITLDSCGYREKREETLKNLAQKISNKVLKTGKSLVLEPMNPYERRIIHSTVVNIDGVNSKSIGEEPYRKVVISSDNPRRNNRRRHDNKRPYREPRSLDLKTSFEKDYKKPKPEDDINAGLYGKIEL